MMRSSAVSYLAVITIEMLVQVQTCCCLMCAGIIRNEDSMMATAIEKRARMYEFRYECYTTTIVPTIRCTLITAKMNSSSNLRTRDDVLHAETASEDEPKIGIEAHHKHCYNPKGPLAHQSLAVGSRIERIAVRAARCSRRLTTATRRRSP